MERVAENIPVQSPLVIERVIGGCNVTLVGLEHYGPIEDYPQEFLEETVSSSGKLVVEYFPPELERTVFNDPLSIGHTAREDAKSHGITDFFGNLERLAEKHNKDVLVLDPANNFWFQFLYLPAPFIFALAGAPLFVADNLDRKMSRRRFLGAGLTLASIQGYSWVLPSDSPLKRYYLNMRDLRWATVAQGLVQYCRENPGQDLTLFYPPFHIEDGINYYLDHPVEREWKYALYSQIPGVTREIRQYQNSPGDSWTLSKISPIR